jgi:hypothetical protein
MELEPFNSQHIIMLLALFPVVKIIFCLLMQQILKNYADHCDIFLCDVRWYTSKMAYNLECFLETWQ